MRTASNRQVTLLRKLNRKKYREQEQLFLLEGARAVRQLITNGTIRVKALFFDEGQGYHLEEEWQKKASGDKGAILNQQLFAEVSDTDNPQGVLALCKMPEEVSVQTMSEAPNTIVALDAVQDPGNVGTIIRTASWFGAAGLLSGKGTVDLFHPKVVRSTAGATGTIAYQNGDLSTLLPAFEEQGWTVALLNKSGKSVPLSTLKSLSRKTILVVGNEGNGIDKSLMIEGRPQAEIPPAASNPPVESLNAAIATSIALYHLAN